MQQQLCLDQITIIYSKFSIIPSLFNELLKVIGCIY